jgi:ubiquinone/menaquinone biosynthesis C-methylase UbiE
MSGVANGASLLTVGPCGCKFAVGVDIVFDSVLKAKGKLPLAHFDVARGEALPFKDASFDHLICTVAIANAHRTSA